MAVRRGARRWSHAEARGANRREAVRQVGRRRRGIPRVGQHERDILAMEIVKTKGYLPAVETPFT
jgi:hypothetical protein